MTFLEKKKQKNHYLGVKVKHEESCSFSFFYSLFVTFLKTVPANTTEVKVEKLRKRCCSQWKNQYHLFICVFLPSVQTQDFLKVC